MSTTSALDTYRIGRGGAVVERASQTPGAVIGSGLDGQYVVALVGGPVCRVSREEIRPADTTEQLRVAMAAQRVVHRIRHAGTGDAR